IKVQERQLEHVFRLLQSGAERRAAHRKQLFAAQPRHVQSRPVAVAVADGEIDILAREIDVMHGRGNPQVNRRMRLANRPRRCTSHLAAKSGEVLTVSMPELCRCTRRSVPMAMRSSASRTTAR